MRHITIVLFLLPFVAFGQYPINVRNIQTGYQTSGEGLFFRGNGYPNYTPTDSLRRHGTFMHIDTVGVRIWAYMQDTTNADSGWVKIFPLSINIPSAVLNGEVVGPITNNKLDTIDRLKFNTLYTPLADTLGTMWFDANSETINAIINGGTRYQLGEELFYPIIINKSGSAILKGQLVMVDPVTPISGDHIRVVPAVNNGTYPSTLIMGLAASQIENDSTGLVTWFGYVSELKQSEIAQTGITLDIGDILYPSATQPGRYTDIAPSSPSHKSSIALVVRKPNGNNNNITVLVRPWLAPRLDDLSDVDVTGRTINSGLLWNGVKWKATTNQVPTIATGNEDYLIKFTGTDALTGEITIGNSVVKESAGNIGIGATPTEKLDVNGTLRIRNTAKSVTSTKLLGVDDNGVVQEVSVQTGLSGNSLVITGNTDLSTQQSSANVLLNSSTGTDVTLIPGGGTTLTSGGSGTDVTISSSNVYNANGSIPESTNRTVTVPETSSLQLTSSTIAGKTTQHKPGVSVYNTTNNTMQITSGELYQVTNPNSDAQISLRGGRVDVFGNSGVDASPQVAGLSVTETNKVVVTQSSSDAATNMIGKAANNELKTLTPLETRTFILPTQTGNDGKYLRTNGSDVTWESVTGNTDLSFTGTTSPVTLNSSTGTDVTITAGSNVTLSQTGNNLTISSTNSGGTVTGTGNVNKIPKWTTTTALGNSVIEESADGNIGISKTPDAGYKLDVNGTTRSTNFIASEKIGINNSSPTALLDILPTSNIAGVSVYVGPTITGGGFNALSLTRDGPTGQTANMNIGFSYFGDVDFSRGTFVFNRGRGSSTSPQGVLSGDYIGSFTFVGRDSNGNLVPSTAQINAIADADATPSTVPQRLSFVTGTTFANRPERMVIKSDGNVGIGITTPSALLHVNGTTILGSSLTLSTSPTAIASNTNQLLLRNTSAGASLGEVSSLIGSSTGQVLKWDGSKWYAGTDEGGGSAIGLISLNGLSASVQTFTQGAGISISSASSTHTFALTGQAAALHNLASNGLIARTGSGTVAARTITAGANIAVTSGDGVSGNPTIAITGTIPIANGGTGNTNGSAATLTTARNIQTNLASTTAASFNGSADVTPGVTGVLSVANGGTGLNSATGYIKGTGSAYTVVNTIPVSEGGTGLGAVNSNGLVLFNNNTTAGPYTRQTPSVYTTSNTGTSLAWDLVHRSSGVYRISHASSTTISSVTVSNVVAGGIYAFHISGASNTVTITVQWPATFKDLTASTNYGTRVYTTPTIITCYYDGTQFVCE